MERLKTITSELQDERIAVVSNLKNFIFDNDPSIEHKDESVQVDEEELEKSERLMEADVVNVETQTNPYSSIQFNPIADVMTQTDPVREPTTNNHNTNAKKPNENVNHNQRAWRERNQEAQKRRQRRLGGDEDDEHFHRHSTVLQSSTVPPRFVSPPPPQPPQPLPQPPPPQPQPPKKELREQGIQTDNIPPPKLQKAETKAKLTIPNEPVKSIEIKTPKQSEVDKSPGTLQRTNSIYARLLTRRESFRDKVDLDQLTSNNPLFKVGDEESGTSKTHKKDLFGLNAAEIVVGQKLKESISPISHRSHSYSRANLFPPKTEGSKRATTPRNDSSFESDAESISPVTTKGNQSSIEAILSQLHSFTQNLTSSDPISPNPTPIADSRKKPPEESRNNYFIRSSVTRNTETSSERVSREMPTKNEENKREEATQIQFDYFDEAQSDIDRSKIAIELFKWDTQNFSEYMSRVKEVFLKRERLLRDEISKLGERIEVLQNENLSLHRGYTDVRTKQAIAILKLTSENLLLTKKLEGVSQHHFDVLKNQFLPEVSKSALLSQMKLKLNGSVAKDEVAKDTKQQLTVQSARGPEKPQEEGADWRKFLNYHPLLSPRVAMPSSVQAPASNSGHIPVVPVRDTSKLGAQKRSFKASTKPTTEPTPKSLNLPIIGNSALTGGGQKDNLSTSVK